MILVKNLIFTEINIRYINKKKIIMIKKDLVNLFLGLIIILRNVLKLAYLFLYLEESWMRT
jgi:hypothetical protein